jgi:hypothetical protein
LNPTSTSNSNPGGQEPNGTDPKGQEPNSKGQEPNETPKPPLPREALEAIVAELRNENADTRVKLKKFEDEKKKQEQAAAKALEDRLKEQGEFKALAEQNESKFKELEPVQEKYSQLSTLVSDQIEAQIKDWPAEAKIFDPGKDVPIEQRLEWMNKAKALVDKLQVQARQPGNGPNPKPSPEPTSDDLKNQSYNKLRATGKYSA